MLYIWPTGLKTRFKRFILSSSFSVKHSGPGSYFIIKLQDLGNHRSNSLLSMKYRNKFLEQFLSFLNRPRLRDMEAVKSQQAAQNVNSAFVPGVKAEANLFLVVRSSKFSG